MWCVGRAQILSSHSQVTAGGEDSAFGKVAGMVVANMSPDVADSDPLRKVRACVLDGLDAFSARVSLAGRRETLARDHYVVVSGAAAKQQPVEHQAVPGNTTPSRAPARPLTRAPPRGGVEFGGVRTLASSRVCSPPSSRLPISPTLQEYRTDRLSCVLLCALSDLP